MAENFTDVAFEAGQLFQQLDQLGDACLELQRDYDAGEIPGGHKRTDCFKDLAQAISDAVHYCEQQFKNEV